MKRRNFVEQLMWLIEAAELEIDYLKSEEEKWKRLGLPCSELYYKGKILRVRKINEYLKDLAKELEVYDVAN